MIPAIDPCGYLWANQGTKKTYFLLRPTVYFAQPIWFLLPLVCCFLKNLSTNNIHETYFLKNKHLLKWKIILLKQKKRGFHENKHFFLKKNKFSLYLLFTALKVCWKFVANFQSNFQGWLQVWLKFSMQTCRAGLKVSMQTFKAGLKV